MAIFGEHQNTEKKLFDVGHTLVSQDIGRRRENAGTMETV